MYISAICQNCRSGTSYYIYSNTELLAQLRTLQGQYQDVFDLLYITGMEVSGSIVLGFACKSKLKDHLNCVVIR